MTLILADRVRETSTTSGTGNLTLAGAVQGSVTFASVCAVGDDFDYLVLDGSNWEIGVGVYSATNTLTRSVRKSSNGNALVSFSSNPKDVILTFPADRSAGIPNRNLLTNSSFRFCQRGNSLTLSDGGMGPDGWFVLSESGTVTCSVSTTPSGQPSYAASISVSSSKRVGFGQVIWHSDTPHFFEKKSWFQVGVVASHASQVVRAAVLHNTGTVDAAVRDFVNNWSSTTYTAGNFFHANWEPLVVVSSLNSVKNFISTPFTVLESVDYKNLAVFIWTESQMTSGNSITISEPILSDIPVPQRYSAPPWEVELASCQRRFFKTFEPGVAPVQNVGNGRGALRLTTYGAGVGHLSQNFPVLMGNTPTITTYNIGAADANWRDTTNSLNRTAGTTGISRSGFAVTCDTPATAMAVNVIHATAEAEPCS